jgi:predicted MFS family arabinose efflux permease
VVRAGDLATANALNTLNDSIARIAGPFVGAALYAWIDIRGTAVVNLLSFALAASLVGLVVAPAIRPDGHQTDDESVVAAMVIGARHVLASPLLRTLCLLQILLALADGPLSAMLVAFIRQTLDRSARDVGIFFSMRGVAGVVGGIVIAHSVRRFRPDRTLVLSLYVLSIEIILLAFLRNFWIIIGMMILVGPVFAALNTVIPTLLQQGSDDAWRGRMFALVGALAGGTFALSTFLGSVLGALTSPPTVMVCSGVLYAFTATVAFLRLPAEVDNARAALGHAP